MNINNVIERKKVAGRLSEACFTCIIQSNPKNSLATDIICHKSTMNYSPRS